MVGSESCAATVVGQADVIAINPAEAAKILMVFMLRVLAN
jgi:hypothetical protein